MNDFIAGLGAFGNPEIIAMLILGTIIGLIFGILPGVGSIQAMALVLPFTFGMDSMTAMYLLAGIIGASTIGGAVTSILIKTPGQSDNLMTTIEGHAMTERGESVRAISISAFSAMFGTFVGLIVMIVLLPFVEQLILNLRAPEIFWIVVLGLMSIAVIVRGNILKGLVAASIGVLLSLVGGSPIFPVSRFDLGIYYFWDGISLVTFFVGLFAISEIMVLVNTPMAASRVGMKEGWRQRLLGLKDVLRNPLVFFRSSILGTIIGLVPGLGGSVANTLSYTTTVQFSRLRKDERPFGTGNVRGLVSCDSASNAKDGGSLLTTVAFGIPGSADMAILLGALVLHGLQPGLQLVTQHANIVWALIIGLAVSQLIVTSYVILGANWFSRILNLRTEFVVLPVLLACLVGAYALNEMIWDVFLMVAAGFLALAMERFGFSIIPIAIGFILGPIVELNLTQSLAISSGSISILFTRPVSIFILALAVLMIAVPVWAQYRVKKKKQTEVPKMKRKLNLGPRKLQNRGAFLFESVLLLVIIAIFCGSLQLGFGPGTVPLVASFCALVFLIPVMVREFVPAVSAETSGGNVEIKTGTGESEKRKESSAKDKWATAVLIIVLLIAVYFIGFFVAVPVCFFVYLLFWQRQSWWIALLFSLVCMLVLYFGIDHLLKLNLWTGAVPEWIPGWLGGEIVPRFW